ncbi:MAG: 50S ribosomal protein L18 [Candidatus Omnitrophica bacterium]|nr:50S ribosomal protein L18 [Candidatus Omnitrophota bacterium]
MKSSARIKRHKRITKKLRGDDTNPRLVVFRSKKHMYAQLVNDTEQRVITGCSTQQKEFKTGDKKTTTVEGAKELGKIVARKSREQGIHAVRFDRAGYRFHGRVKALAEGAREGGLKF